MIKAIVWFQAEMNVIFRKRMINQQIDFLLSITKLIPSHIRTTLYNYWKYVNVREKKSQVRVTRSVRADISKCGLHIKQTLEMCNSSSSILRPPSISPPVHGHPSKHGLVSLTQSFHVLNFISSKFRIHFSSGTFAHPWRWNPSSGSNFPSFRRIFED